LLDLNEQLQPVPTRHPKVPVSNPPLARRLLGATPAIDS
jgi:hypothetical protein